LHVALSYFDLALFLSTILSILESNRERHCYEREYSLDAMRREKVRQTAVLEEINASLKSIANNLAKLSSELKVEYVASAPPATQLQPPGGKPIYRNVV
jgi:predicted  nucleic acid-binding Zn-ribbon protein